MKRSLNILALALLLMILLSSLVSCGESYKMRESSKEEATPVFTLGEDTVNFEMLYTFFLNRLEVAGLDSARLDGEAFDNLLAAAEREIAEIYALFSICREVGIDPYSKDVESKITEYIKTSVEGGVVGDTWMEGYESYDAYLADIRERLHMNDAVNRLMIRYAVCENLLIEYYNTEHRYEEADVEAFFKSEDCLHIVWVGRTATDGGLDRAENLSLMSSIRNKLIAGDVRGAIQLSLRPDTDFYMGRYSKDDAYYGELIDTAYKLGEGETSGILDLGAQGFFVVKRLTKAAADFEERYAEIEAVYLADSLYGRVEERAGALLRGILYADRYHSLTAGDFVQ